MRKLSPCLFLLAWRIAVADSIPIENAGFEEVSIGNKVFIAADGWEIYDPTSSGFVVNGGNYGAYNPPDIAYPGGPPEGENIGWVYNLTPVEIGMQQTLDTTVIADTEYVLKVMVGDPIDYDGFGMTGFPGYRIELVADAGGADEIVLAVDENSLEIEEGTFEESVLSVEANAFPDSLGEQLTIRLTAFPGEGIDVDFDNVRLEASTEMGDLHDFRILDMQIQDDGEIEIEWNSQPQERYEILVSETLEAFSVIVPEVASGGAKTTHRFSDPPSMEEGSRYYIVRQLE